MIIMVMTMPLRILLPISLLVLSACASRLALQPPESVNLSGTWVLNEELSQDVIVMPMRQSGGFPGGGGGFPGGGQRPSGAPPGGAGGGGGGRPPGGGRGGGGSVIPQKSPAMTATEMTIEQDENSMGFAYPNEMYRDVDWGEKEVRGAEVTAGWDDETLVIKTKRGRFTFTETYLLEPEGKVLTQTVALKTPRGSQEFVRIFELQEGEKELETATASEDTANTE